MIIGISGANSFIGKNLINFFLKKNYQLILFVRNINSLKHLSNNKNIQIIQISMVNYETIINEIPILLDAFIHLAWEGTRGEKRDDEFIQKSNYLTSVKLFKALNEKKCKKIISFGSQAEYGNHDDFITENSIRNPTSYYGKYKSALSDFLEKEITQTYFWFRIFSAYGPYDYENSLIMRLVKSIKSHYSYIDLTSCEQNWNYLYIDDVIDITHKAIINNKSLKGAYNLASNDNRKLKDYIYETISITKSNIEPKFGAIDISSNKFVSFKADVSKIVKDFDINRFVKFKKGLLNVYNSNKI